jgi:hypothetical protein
MDLKKEKKVATTGIVSFELCWIIDYRLSVLALVFIRPVRRRCT